MNTETKEYIEPIGFKGSPGKWYISYAGDMEGKGKYFPSVVMGGEYKAFQNRIIVNTSHNSQSESIMANAILLSNSKELAKSVIDLLFLIENRIINSGISVLHIEETKIKNAKEALNKALNINQ